MKWFTSDWHLDHTNIIKYSNRPFNNIDEMNWTIIENCNRSVSEKDSLYFLGDFCFTYKKDRLHYWFKQIKCKNIYFIFGNHDKTLHKHQGILHEYCLDFGDMLTVKDDPDIILNHYKMCIWDRQHYGTYHLYGHSHGMANDNIDKLSFDCGVDCNNFKPFSLVDVKERMKTKNAKTI